MTLKEPYGVGDRLVPQVPELSQVIGDSLHLLGLLLGADDEIARHVIGRKPDLALDHPHNSAMRAA